MRYADCVWIKVFHVFKVEELGGGGMGYFDSFRGNLWPIPKLRDMSEVSENICWTFWNFLWTCILQTRIITDQNFWKIHYITCKLTAPHFRNFFQSYLVSILSKYKSNRKITIITFCFFMWILRTRISKNFVIFVL